MINTLNLRDVAAIRKHITRLDNEKALAEQMLKWNATSIKIQDQIKDCEILLYVLHDAITFYSPEKIEEVAT